MRAEKTVLLKQIDYMKILQNVKCLKMILYVIPFSVISSYIVHSAAYPEIDYLLLIVNLLPHAM